MGVFQKPEDFARENLAKSFSKARLLWLTKELKPSVKKILGHDYASIRIRYWQGDGKTVWVLEEIGKVKPITAGFVVKNGLMLRMKVLAFRETRGYEIVHPFFTKQFAQQKLNGRLDLSKQVDGISGATLSVRAMKKCARLALFLDRVVNPPEPTDS